jgi:hypothetical protein
MDIIVYSAYWNTRTEINNLADAFVYNKLPYRISEFIFSQSRSEMEEWENAVDRAMRVCRTSGVPVEYNFKRIYLVTTRGIVKDWMLSALARRLVLINASPNNILAARLQLQLLKLAENKEGVNEI